MVLQVHRVVTERPIGGVDVNLERDDVTLLQTDNRIGDLVVGADWCSRRQIDRQ